MTTPVMVTSPTGGVLVASASTSLRERVLRSLYQQSWPVQEALGGADALIKLETGNWQLIFLDRRLPDLDTEELIQIIKRRFPGIRVVMLDSDGGKPISVAGTEAMPAQTACGLCLAMAADTAIAATRGSTRAQVEPLPGMIGRAEAMQRIYQLARLVAPRTTTVLITGPTGTGKELVARAIHQLSPRAPRTLVLVNCAAIPESLLESELFGHVRGAFTGAVQAYPGRIYAAHGGTLFLDEIGELPLSLQAKLLRFLDQKEVQRLGSAETARVDVRVVAATNANLARGVDEGKFRADLYYRLSAFPLELPSLAERAPDIVPLAEHFLRTMAAAARCAPLVLSREAIRILHSHSWAGNVRELQQVMERAAILADGNGTILPEHLCFPTASLRRSNRSAQD